MKIRIRGNSLRYRLTMTEVEAFSRTGTYEESTSIGDMVFRYAVKAVSGLEALSAKFENDTITLLVPGEDAAAWAGNSKIGFSHVLQLPKGEQLSLLLEKDFACLDDTGEDQSDNFPNPKAPA